MKIPDFFIVGASKCGTSALSEYVSQHSKIAFSRTKEPHYFSEDFPHQKVDRTLNEYWRRNFSHFDAAKHSAIGEGSGTYYLSAVAVPKILELNHSAKFIYLVRNPVDMSYSMYFHNRFGNSDDASSFEEAWKLQESRSKGIGIPRPCTEPRFLQYRDIGSLGSRLQVLNTQIPRGQLLVIVFDDFMHNPKKVYERTLEFLQVPSDGREHFPIVNENKVQRSKILGHAAASIPRWLHNTVRELKHLSGMSRASFNVLARLNAKPFKRPPIPQQFRNRLVTEFASEVRLLEDQLGRDLSHWR